MEDVIVVNEFGRKVALPKRMATETFLRTNKLRVVNDVKDDVVEDLMDEDFGQEANTAPDIPNEPTDSSPEVEVVLAEGEKPAPKPKKRGRKRKAK